MLKKGKKMKSNTIPDSYHVPGVEVSRKQKRSSSRLTWASGQSIAKTAESKKGCIAIGAAAIQFGANAPLIGWTLLSTTREELPRGKTLVEKKREKSKTQEFDKASSKHR